MIFVINAVVGKSWNIIDKLLIDNSIVCGKIQMSVRELLLEAIHSFHVPFVLFVLLCHLFHPCLPFFKHSHYSFSPLYIVVVVLTRVVVLLESFFKRSPIFISFLYHKKRNNPNKLKQTYFHLCRHSSYT